MSARVELARFALTLVATLGLGGIAHAQDFPTVISPLRFESDNQGVNLIDGRTVMEMPTLSVPGAPNLRFDRLQNAAPYVKGTVQTPLGTEVDERRYAIHTGTGASDSFQCENYVCTSITGTGSTFRYAGRRYQQSGSGAVWQFNLLHSSTASTHLPYQTMMYYASSVAYPNGEVITYTYTTATLNNDPFPGRVFYRPATITSNLGYTISLTFAGSDFNGDMAAWNTLTQAAIYSSADPSTPLGRLTYSGNTITDLGGRVYTCTGCNNGLGTDIEVSAGTMQLPGEGSPARQVAPVTSVPQSAVRPVGSVTQDGVQWSYSYDNLRGQGPLQDISNGYLYDHLTVTGPNGSHVVYDVGQRPIYMSTIQQNVITRVTDSLGRSTAYEFDASYRPTRVTYPELNRIDVSYDEFGNVTQRITTPKADGGSALTESASYPTATCVPDGTSTPLCWRPAWSRDSMQRQTDYAYNSLGQLTEQIDPADANGVRRRTTTVYETSTGISRRSAVRICPDTGASCTTSAPIQTTYDYTGRGSSLLPAAVTQVDGTGALAPLVTQYGYDAAGRVTMVDGPLTGTDDAAYNRYDAWGRKEWEIGALGANGLRMATHTAYRGADDKVSYTETGTVPAWNSSTLTVISRTDQTYDTRRNPIRAAVTAGGAVQAVTDKAWDDSGRLVCTAVRMNPAQFGASPGACALTTAGSQGPDRITVNSYDAAGQMLQEIRAYLTPEQQNYATYTYSANGRQLRVTDANGNRAEMTYDGFDRQIRWNFPSPTTAGITSTTDYEAYTYDAVGNRLSLRKRDGTTLTFSYDSLNRLILKVVPERAGLAVTQTRDVYYGYDLRNAQLFARFDGPTGDGVTNAYDGFGRLTSSTLNMDGVSRAVSSLYREDDARTRVTHPDGQAFTYAYSPAAELTGVYQGLGTGIPLDTFTYDTQSRLVTRTEGPGVSSVGYTYDAPGRLAGITDTFAGGTGNVALTFGYNAANQITQRTRSNDAYASNTAYAVNRNYSVNGLNQYSAAGGATFGYDANGNLTSDGSNTYVYDIENRLVTASGGHTATLRYDPLGRLYEVAGTSGTTRLFYDGDALVAEYNSAGALTARYVHGSNAEADDPLIWFGGGVTHWLHADHQGSIVATTSGSGATLSINAYDEWGIPNATNVGRFQYTGQAWLSELGLYYYKARMYSPTLGRFIQTDPIGYEGGINLYEYVGDDPLNHADPSGNEAANVTCMNNACGQGSFSLTWNGVADLIDGVTNVVVVVETIATFGGSAAGPDEAEIAIERLATRGLRSLGPEARATARQESGIVYRRTNPQTGRCYIGRCNSEELFARRQRYHDRMLGRRHEYEVLERGRPGRPLREAEQRHIDAHGGPTNRRNPNGGTENRRNEIAPCRGTRIGNAGTGSIC